MHANVLSFQKTTMSSGGETEDRIQELQELQNAELRKFRLPEESLREQNLTSDDLMPNAP
jgi:hypothetical protein